MGIGKPLPGAGEKNPDCASMEPLLPNGGEENTRSLGSLLTFGKVKIAAFGDLENFLRRQIVVLVDLFTVRHRGPDALDPAPVCQRAALDVLAVDAELVGDPLGIGDVRPVVTGHPMVGVQHHGAVRPTLGVCTR